MWTFGFQIAAMNIVMHLVRNATAIVLQLPQGQSPFTDIENHMPLCGVYAMNFLLFVQKEHL